MDERDYKALNRELNPPLQQCSVGGRSELFVCRNCKQDKEEWLDGLCEDCTLKTFDRQTNSHQLLYLRNSKN